MQKRHVQCVKVFALILLLPCLYGCQGGGGSSSSGSLSSFAFGSGNAFGGGEGSGSPPLVLESFSITDTTTTSTTALSDEKNETATFSGETDVTNTLVDETKIPEAELAKIHNPEPATMLLLGSGMTAMLVRRRKRNQKQ